MILYADPETIHEIELLKQLKDENGINADGTQSLFF